MDGGKLRISKSVANLETPNLGWESSKLGVRQFFLPLILGAVSPIKICLTISMQKM